MHMQLLRTCWQVLANRELERCGTGRAKFSWIYYDIIDFLGLTASGQVVLTVLTTNSKIRRRFKWSIIRCTSCMDSLQYHKSQLQVHCRVCTGKLGSVVCMWKACQNVPRMYWFKCLQWQPRCSPNQILQQLLCCNQKDQQGIIGWYNSTKLPPALLIWTAYWGLLQRAYWGLLQIVQSVHPLQRKGKRGRPRKHKNIASCPRSVVGHICAVDGPSLQCILPLPIECFFTPAPGSFSLSDLKCPVCQTVVDEPVELACKSPICYTCCISMLWKSDGGVTECPLMPWRTWASHQ